MTEGVFYNPSIHIETISYHSVKRNFGFTITTVMLLMWIVK